MSKLVENSHVSFPYNRNMARALSCNLRAQSRLFMRHLKGGEQ